MPYTTTYAVLVGVPKKEYKSQTVFASWKAGERINIRHIMYNYLFDDRAPKIVAVTYHNKYIDIAECDIYLEYWCSDARGDDEPLLSIYMNGNLWMIANQQKRRLATLWSSNYGKPECLKDWNAAKLKLV